MKRDSGFALLIVLWALVLLSLILSQLLAAGRSEAQLAGNLRYAAVAEAIADGAVPDTLFHIVTGAWPPRGTHTLRIGRGTASVRVDDFSGEINPNTAGLPLLRAVITLCGATPAQATQLAQAIMTWRGAPDDDPAGTLAAYQSAGLPYAPLGLPMQTIDEVALVVGMTPSLLACLAPHLSLYQDGDPGPHASDRFVAQAVAMAEPVATDTAASPTVLRITATATVTGGRFTREAVVRLTPGVPGLPYKILEWRAK